MEKHYIISINQLVNTFSRVEAGKEFDFTLNTSEVSPVDSAIENGDNLLVTVADEIYYQFVVIDKTDNVLKLKKVFEIEKSIAYRIDEEGIIIEIPQEEYSVICDKLFSHLVNDSSLSEETKNEVKTYIKEKYTGRFVFQVLTYLNELDNINKIKPYFKQNSDPNYTSIKTEEISLTSIFKSSENKLSKDELTFNDGKPRFFEDTIFFWENKYFYLSTEWTSGKESRLDLDSFKILIEKYYPEFSIYEENGFYLFSDRIQEVPILDQIDFDLSGFQNACKKAGLVYTDLLVSRLAGSLLTKPFVLLSGLSGSGKTKLAQSFAQWICEDKTQYCIVPVGADWTNREPLLGYVNALDSTEYILPENGALQLIIDANKEENQNKPYFLILDEMNLSHVERYFADFLSVMESKDKFKLHSDKVNEKSKVPYELDWPKNLFVVGTVNIDETTYMFSPKVLDRSNVIEFRVNKAEIKDFLNIGKEITPITKMGAAMGSSFVAISKDNTKNNDFTKLNSELLDFFKELQILGAEFGYRTASEIQTLFSKIDLVNPSYSDKIDEKIDIAIMQKLLPKLHGSRRKLLKTLNLLANKCLDREQETLFNERGIYTISEGNKIKYNLSFEKIARMYRNAIENGFASYAEA